ncbi:MAG: hypothetical protein ACYS1A_12905 [Planctomycetota bacterium]|jgi:hypothetical protein
MSHAGYAALITIDQRFLQNSIRISWLANTIPHTMQVSAGLPGLISFDFDLFTDCPAITLASAEPQMFLVQLDAWGGLQVPPMAPEPRTIRLVANIRVPHQVSFVNGDLSIGMVPSHAMLDSHSIEVLQGGEYPESVRNVLNSNLFATQLEAALREGLVGTADTLPTVDVGFLNRYMATVDPDLDAPVERVATGRSLNGVFAIGIDMFQGGFGTAGNPSQMTDVTGGLSVGMVANPWIWVPNLRHELLKGSDGDGGLEAQIAAQGVSLDTFDLSPMSGFLRASGSATRDSGSVDFSIDLVPRLGRPAQWIDLGPDQVDPWPCVVYIPPVDELWFETENVQVTLNVPYWLTFLQILGGLCTFGIAALIIESIKDMIQGNVEGAMASTSGLPTTGLEYSFAESEGVPPILARLERFQFTPNSMDMGLSIESDFPEPGIVCTNSRQHTYSNRVAIDVGEIQRGLQPTFRVELPEVAHPEDPFLRIAWNVRRIDTNQIVQTADDVGVTGITVTAPANAPDLKIQCRVYRTLGSSITEVYLGNLVVHFLDLLDRSKPFVRWYHYVWTPDVRRDEAGRKTVVGGSIKYRTSRIHRTDLEGRCKFASRYSVEIPEGFRPPPNSERPLGVFYYDTLPFPNSQILENRSELCDYCFFGGPDKTTPLPIP